MYTQDQLRKFAMDKLSVGKDQDGFLQIVEGLQYTHQVGWSKACLNSTLNNAFQAAGIPNTTRILLAKEGGHFMTTQERLWLPKAELISTLKKESSNVPW